MEWVTRQGIRLDRSACIWLILRHIDPDAEILFKSEEDFQAAVEAGARPFHSTVSEEPAIRERTTFQQLIAEYRQQHPDAALDLMGDIIRGAETKAPDSIEESEGIRAVAKGINALSHGDVDTAKHMIPIFDAVYAYCQRRVENKRGWANADPGWHADASNERLDKSILS